MPGAGHLWLGRAQKGASLLVLLTVMFAFGLWIEGRLFPFEFADPLVGLAALADLGVGLAVFRAKPSAPASARRGRDLRVRTPS